MSRVSRLTLLAALLQGAALAPAAAANWDDSDTTRILGDPSFLPVAGQVEGVVDYSYKNDRYDFQAYNGPYTTSYIRSYTGDTQGVLPTLRYGITDDITVFADLGWASSRSHVAYIYDRYILGIPIRAVPTRAQANFRAIGADDPDIGITWRVVDQRNAPVSLDLTGIYAPDIFDSRTAATRTTGSVAAGGQSGSIEAAVSRQMTVLTLRLFGKIGYDGRRNEFAEGFGDLRSAPHAVYAAGLQGQVRLSPWLAVDAGISAQQAMRFDRDTVEDGYIPATALVKPSGSISPYAGLVVPLVDRHLVAEIQYQHDFINNEVEDFVGGRNQRYFRQQANIYTARVLFAFGGAPTVMPIPPQAAPAPPVTTIDYSYIVFFDWDRADLSARARAIVAAAAQASAHQQATRIDVDGYTDLSGSAGYNRRLSLRRAMTVKSELIRDGVVPGEIAVHGYGASNPLVPTAPGVREPQNRRVEIILK